MTKTNSDTDSKVDKLPPFKVILHNDDKNKANDVVDRIREFLPSINESKAINIVKDAHENEKSVMVITHKEHAELIVEQFTSCLPVINVTYEKA